MSKENTEALAAPDELLPPMRMRLGATPAEWEVAASQARVTRACSMMLIGGGGDEVHAELMAVEFAFDSDGEGDGPMAASDAA